MLCGMKKIALKTKSLLSIIFYPASEKEADVEAARKKLFECPDLENWTWNVSWWSDPVMLGTYPEDGLKKYEPYLPNIAYLDHLQLLLVANQEIVFQDDSMSILYD